jgi:hypothetical protein
MDAHTAVPTTLILRKLPELAASSSRRSFATAHRCQLLRDGVANDIPQEEPSHRREPPTPYGQEQVGNLKVPILVDQLKEPVVFRYSWV